MSLHELHQQVAARLCLAGTCVQALDRLGRISGREIGCDRGLDDLHLSRLGLDQISPVLRRLIPLPHRRH